jgi:hypothetical protein
VTEKGIVRGICHFSSWQQIIPEVIRAVGVLADPDVEWTGYVYEGFPYYVNVSGWEVDSGIFLFRWKNPEDWRNPKNRISERHGELLWRPRGWATPQ